MDAPAAVQTGVWTLTDPRALAAAFASRMSSLLLGRRAGQPVVTHVPGRPPCASASGFPSASPASEPGPQASPPGTAVVSLHSGGNHAREKAAKGSPNAERERKAIPLDIKLELLRRFEVGEKLSQIAKALDLAVSAVATNRDNKEKITVSSQVATPSRAARLTRHRSAAMETMERRCACGWKTRASGTCRWCCHDPGGGQEFA